MAERIQKILSQWGIASRRKAEQMILEGKVKLNNRVAILGDKADITQDILEIEGKVIQSNHRPQKTYLLLNKPLAVVSTCYDPQSRPTVLDLLPAKLKERQGIHPVGRLDFNSTGALLLTNDGDLTLKLTHPRYHLPKTYLVWLNGHPTRQDLQLWRTGVTLSDYTTLPAEITIVRKQINKTLLKIVLQEGKNRQIRRIAEQLGFRVLSLHRTHIGSLSLTSSEYGNLPSGKYRHLSETEVIFLKKESPAITH
ncbi:MAG: pseudouridine synthase [Xenococcaceae cyanobacterium MO_167.B52]|nr:pseudouridine synthase [Xenococcaceae cyanobacterium MO_167.B52]